jgi:CheY-like chemotaxis protein
LGQGSEFIVRLPAAERDTAPEGPTSPARTKATVRPALRVLIVDDNQDAADTMAELVRTIGANVKVAYDGDSALQVLRTHRPSVVVLDLGMPGLDGHEVARRMRLDPEFRDVTLIALTGWGQEENRRRTKEAGFDHHLVKPVEFATLEALLTSAR